MRYLKIVVLSFCFLLVSCEKELDFRYHDIDPVPVIQGVLTEDRCEVSITLTSPMDEPMDRTHVTDAVVELRDLSSGHESLL